MDGGSHNKCLVSVTTPFRVFINNCIAISQNTGLSCRLYWIFNNYIEDSYQLYFKLKLSYVFAVPNKTAGAIIFQLASSLFGEEFPTKSGKRVVVIKLTSITSNVLKYVNPFVPNAPFLYPLKTSENHKVF